jgi:hypothetical protein
LRGLSNEGFGGAGGGGVVYYYVRAERGEVKSGGGADAFGCAGYKGGFSAEGKGSSG